MNLLRLSSDRIQVGFGCRCFRVHRRRRRRRRTNKLSQYPANSHVNPICRPRRTSHNISATNQLISDGSSRGDRAHFFRLFWLVSSCSSGCFLVANHELKSRSVCRFVDGRTDGRDDEIVRPVACIFEGEELVLLVAACGSTARARTWSGILVRLDLAAPAAAAAAAVAACGFPAAAFVIRKRSAEVHGL